MVSADVKADVKQQEVKEPVISCNFYKKNLQNLKYNVKQVCIFHLILQLIVLGIPSKFHSW